VRMSVLYHLLAGAQPAPVLEEAVGL
jgi:hypothetical protein